MTDPAEARRFYASLLAAKAGAADPRIEEAFAAVPREAFLGPGPWKIVAGRDVVAGRDFVVTPDNDPAYIYRNALVALDAEKGINNGEPLLHAMWMTKVAPRRGETITHVGAGTGYYTALLSLLGGSVTAFELEPELAARASRNLAPYANVSLVHGDAVTENLPPSDVIYVNAGVAAPPASWLKALKAGGRLIFPWRPARDIGLAVMVTRTGGGFACEPFMRSWFIPCVGASATDAAVRAPSRKTAEKVRSLWLIADNAPDRTATAIYDDVWFSGRSVTER